MKLRSLALGFVMAAASCVASAAPYTITLNPTSPHVLSASFGSTPVAGAFTDVFTFTPSVPTGTSAFTFALNLSINGSGQPDPALTVHFNAVDINGTSLYPINLPAQSQFSGLALNLNGPIVLTVSGISGGGSYTGLINVATPVPEPETYGMMLAGLALVGVVARRKQRS